MNRELADKGLSRPRGRSDEHASPRLERVASGDLKRIEIETLIVGDNDGNVWNFLEGADDAGTEVT